MWRGVLKEYRSFFDLDDVDVVSLREGGTPLVPLPLPEAPEIEVWVKCEGLNPTGSFKDRGMTLAVTMAGAQGARAVVCASTGNTSAAAAAYAARAGLAAVVVIPAGKVARGKLSQALIHGARVVAVEGSFDDAFGTVQELAGRHEELVLVNSVNPHRIPGQRTAAFEICDQLSGAPDYLALPVGNGGNITAYWRGFNDYRDAGRVDTVPTMLGAQAAGAAPVVSGGPVTSPETEATAIRIGDPAHFDRVSRALSESGGSARAVDDDAIAAAHRRLAGAGLLVEPASAAPVAALLRWVDEGRFDAGDRIVCVATGHGLKDPDYAAAQVRPDDGDVPVHPAEADAVAGLLGDLLA